MNTIDTAPSSEAAFAAAISSNANWIRYNNLKRFYYAGASYGTFSALTVASNQMVSANASLTDLTLFANGSLTDTIAVALAKVPANTNFLAFLQTFVSAIYSDSVLGMVYAGGNLAAEASDFYNAWNTYRTSI
jgi:hypothetical protein